MTDEQKETLSEMKLNHWYYFQAGKFISFFDGLEKLGLVEKKTLTGKKSNGQIVTMFGYRKTNKNSLTAINRDASER